MVGVGYGEAHGKEKRRTENTQPEQKLGEEKKNEKSNKIKSKTWPDQTESRKEERR